jgi:putative oxidoreductase
VTRRCVWLWIMRLARWFLGGVFVYAGAVKVFGPEAAREGGRAMPAAVKYVLGVEPTAPGVTFAGPIAFRNEIKNYQLGSWYWVIHPAAIVLPWVEIIVGVALIFGLWMVESTILIWAMLIFFNVMVAGAMVRGLDIRCGCFGGDQKVGWTKLL